MDRRRLLAIALIGLLLGAVVAYAVVRRGGSPAPDPTPGAAKGAAQQTGPVRLSEQEVRDLARRVPTPRQESFYFVMTDRFANGEKGNDRGGLSGDRLSTGFDPSDKGMFHGGDIAGLIGKLDYIRGLGTTAIWLTPSFVNRPVQGEGEEASAGYHGYWITDFTRIDPHLGSNAEMKQLIAAAHDRGMKVYFDIVTNHTADVIDSADGEHSYVAKADQPYRDSSGKEFDDAAIAGSKEFPALSPDSFPRQPVFRSPADATAKTPAWLNDRTLYHNRGDSTFEGESSLYGDFGGLDDLFTENPAVVDGMIDIYTAWIDFGIDGFRIDTVKHVNLPFWQRFGPALMEHARAAGKDDFFMFGEVYDSSPAAMSLYSTAGNLPATLDFGFQSAAIDFVSGNSAKTLQELYEEDDGYIDGDSDAYSLPTFLGNHDLGRVASLLQGSALDDEDLLHRVELALSLMYLTRGQPVVYYGDEQGLVGQGGDKDARQDMFATKVKQYAEDRVVGGEPGARDRYDSAAPLYRHIAALAKLRQEHPALRSGTQVERYAADGEGVYAFSRIDRESGVEYLVAVNNAGEEQRVALKTASTGARFEPLLGSTGGVQAGADGGLTLAIPGRAAVVLRAESPIQPDTRAPAITSLVVGTDGEIDGFTKLTAEVDAATPVEVTFALRSKGSSDWTVLGTDDNPAYGLYADSSRLAPGEYEVVALARTLDGRTGYTSGLARVADPEEATDLITAPGSYQSEAGCPGDWAPDCAATTLEDPDGDGTYVLTVDGLPAGSYEFKVAVGGSWAENYGAGGAKDGPNIPFTVASDGAPVTFTYVLDSHRVSVDTS